MIKTLFTAVAAILLAGSASAHNATNWVGAFAKSTDSACYRKTHIMKVCPTGYAYDNVATCWAQCPLDFPVECGMECLPQNSNCTTEVITKVGSVARVALDAATSSIFSGLVKAAKDVRQGVMCGQKLRIAIKKIVGYVDDYNHQFPTHTVDEILYVLSRVDFVAFVLPATIETCLGLNPGGPSSDAVNNIVLAILNAAIKDGHEIFVDFKHFIQFMRDISLHTVVEAFTGSDVAKLENLMESGSPCGESLQDAVDDVVGAVAAYKANTSLITVPQIRLAITRSDLFLNQIPAITTACMPDDSPASYVIRSKIRKALYTIVDKVIDTGDSNGTPIAVGQYIASISDLVLDIISIFDPTGIASLAEQFIQPICGPTSFIGEVDDGDLFNALGLRTDGKAFAGSWGSWSKSGDGIARITFVSQDSKDVTVDVHSAGQKIQSVKLKAKDTVSWSTSIASIQDKTLYLDRWRSDAIGIPGSGGGSLKLWVSRSSAGGHLELYAFLNES